MEETAEKISIIQIPEKEEIDWAEYLDYSKFYEPGETNNKSLDRHIKDFSIDK